ncbi:hypothetical protein EDEG_01476 [Edhazardia aedis USNM 41457]|uniref:Uncharacterized protein n=1 Tax=Edhazardia aedis (strain USNM 41457) TaxID=1003232 RepID=J9D9R1_EDHAE|nr:hypothetical protein EDEG_01476 [Edhazardia aedis USNM 41457]|eukprot:EJW04244.1 hypothetical protein EDEG_01476 [Edhazardia aedis USNM 41457]
MLDRRFIIPLVTKCSDELNSEFENNTTAKFNKSAKNLDHKNTICTCLKANSMIKDSFITNIPSAVETISNHLNSDSLSCNDSFQKNKNEDSISPAIISDENLIFERSNKISKLSINSNSPSNLKRSASNNGSEIIFDAESYSIKNSEIARSKSADEESISFENIFFENCSNKSQENMEVNAMCEGTKETKEMKIASKSNDYSENNNFFMCSSANNSVNTQFNAKDSYKEKVEGNVKEIISKFDTNYVYQKIDENNATKSVVCGENCINNNHTASFNNKIYTESFDKNPEKLVILLEELYECVFLNQSIENLKIYAEILNFISEKSNIYEYLNVVQLCFELYLLCSNYYFEILDAFNKKKICRDANLKFLSVEYPKIEISMKPYSSFIKKIAEKILKSDDVIFIKIKVLAFCTFLKEDDFMLEDCKYLNDRIYLLNFLIKKNEDENIILWIKNNIESIIHSSSIYIQDFEWFYFISSFLGTKTTDEMQKIIVLAKSHRILNSTISDFKEFTISNFINILINSYDDKKDDELIYTTSIFTKFFSINPSKAEHIFKIFILRTKTDKLAGLFFDRCSNIDSDYIEVCLICSKYIDDIKDEYLISISKSHYFAFLTRKLEIFNKCIRKLGYMKKDFDYCVAAKSLFEDNVYLNDLSMKKILTFLQIFPMASNVIYPYLVPNLQTLNDRYGFLYDNPIFSDIKTIITDGLNASKKSSLSPEENLSSHISLKYEHKNKQSYNSNLNIHLNGQSYVKNTQNISPDTSNFSCSLLEHTSNDINRSYGNFDLNDKIYNLSSVTTKNKFGEKNIELSSTQSPISNVKSKKNSSIESRQSSSRNNTNTNSFTNNVCKIFSEDFLQNLYEIVNFMREEKDIYRFIVLLIRLDFNLFINKVVFPKKTNCDDFFVKSVNQIIKIFDTIYDKELFLEKLICFKENAYMEKNFYKIVVIKQLNTHLLIEDSLINSSLLKILENSADENYGKYFDEKISKSKNINTMEKKKHQEDMKKPTKICFNTSNVAKTRNVIFTKDLEVSKHVVAEKKCAGELKKIDNKECETNFMSQQMSTLIKTENSIENEIDKLKIRCLKKNEDFYKLKNLNENRNSAKCSQESENFKFNSSEEKCMINDKLIDSYNGETNPKHNFNVFNTISQRLSDNVCFYTNQKSEMKIIGANISEISTESSFLDKKSTFTPIIENFLYDSEKINNDLFNRKSGNDSNLIYTEKCEEDKKIVKLKAILYSLFYNDQMRINILINSLSRKNNIFTCDTNKIDNIMKIMELNNQYKEGMMFYNSYIKFESKPLMFCFYGTFYQYDEDDQQSIIKLEHDQITFELIIHNKRLIKRINSNGKTENFLLTDVMENTKKLSVSIKFVNKKCELHLNQITTTFKMYGFRRMVIGHKFKGIVSRILYYESSLYDKKYLCENSRSDYFISYLRDLEKIMIYQGIKGFYLDNLKPYEINNNFNIEMKNIIHNENINWIENKKLRDLLISEMKCNEYMLEKVHKYLSNFLTNADR